jgi:hypothetical protein
MKLLTQSPNGGWPLWMKNLLQAFAQKFESPRKREFKKLKRFIKGFNC